MKMEFKQAVHLNGKDYYKGTHDVSEEVLKSKLAHSMILNGLIVEAKQEITATSIMDNQRKLAEKLMASKAPVKEFPQEAEEPEWEPQVEAVEEKPEEHQKPAPKAKHKTRKR